MVYKKILSNNNDRKIIVSHGKSLTKSRRARDGEGEKQRNKFKHEKQVIKNTETTHTTTKITKSLD